MKDEIKEILNNQKLIDVENDYERIIFEYLANNCSEFDDEHIKQLVNLKVEQYKQSLDYITNLQDRINKAIEYIDNRCLDEYGYVGYGDDLNPRRLVNILKGEDE